MASEKEMKTEETAPETPTHHEHAGEKELSTTSPDDPEHRAVVPDEGRPSPWTLKNIITTCFLSGLYVGEWSLCAKILLTCAGSQIPLYFVGGSLSFIAADLGGLDVISWLPVAYGLALAAVAPFCGYMQDLLGRRYVTLLGGASLNLGIIVLATAQSFGAALVGMGFAGAGAAIGELTALAG
jgi:MFS family permease